MPLDTDGRIKDPAARHETVEARHCCVGHHCICRRSRSRLVSLHHPDCWAYTWRNAFHVFLHFIVNTLHILQMCKPRLSVLDHTVHRQLFETIMQQGIRRRESRRVARRCIGDPVAVADETYSAANAMLCPPPNPSESIVVPHFRSHLENAFWVLLRGPSWPHICRSTFGIPN